jgi:hypothetical protein
MSELLTISEVAEILGVGEDTVTRRFAKVKGVVDLGSPETPKRRRYRVLRIPKSVLEKYLLTRGGPVSIETPPMPPKPSKKKASDVPPTEDELVRQLAAITKQQGTYAQKKLDLIAERARLLRFVPEDRWAEVVWISSEDDDE